MHTENLVQSRNSGLPYVFPSYRKSMTVQTFLTNCISFIQKIWVGPEILDQLYISFIQKMLVFPEILDLHTKTGLVQNTISGQGVVNHNLTENLCKFQKFWRRRFRPSVYSVFYAPDILDTVLFEHQKFCICSRNSG